MPEKWKNTKEEDWVPSIVYEEEQQIPMIMVPTNKKMPVRLFVLEFYDTGKLDPTAQTPNGQDMPIHDVIPHQYFDHDVLKARLDFETFDKVRLAMGLDPLQKAAEEGKKIIDGVRKVVEK